MSRRRPRNRFPRSGWIVGILFLGAHLLPGCTALVRPPRAVQDPVQVFLVHDGAVHTGLVLPDGEEGWIEYAFGDYRWYMEGRSSRSYGAYALLFNTRGAFGRRHFASEPARDSYFARPEIVLESLQVERAFVAKLRAKLAMEFDELVETRTFNQANGLDFVGPYRRYGAVANCVHQTAEWLRELGCDVSRQWIVRRLRVVRPED